MIDKFIRAESGGDYYSGAYVDSLEEKLKRILELAHEHNDLRNACSCSWHEWIIEECKYLDEKVQRKSKA